MKSGYASFFNVPTRHHSRKFSKGFTIVELLVVIVVIGVLAAIIITSYNGVQEKAIVASLKFDLSNASRKLKMYYIENSAYPNSITDCPVPAAGNMCIKPTSNNTFSSYTVSNTTNPTFTVTASNGGRIYKITNDTNPIAVNSAPLAPVADWIATTQGNHYGNFYDLIGKSFATVNRSTTKTIYDPLLKKIYDVPANYLAINPRSDDKSGSEAVIEEARTNYVTRSYFNSDSNSDGLTDNWYEYKTASGTVTYSRPADAVYGTNSQRAQFTSVSDSNKAWQIASGSLSGVFSPGETAVGSIYMKGSATGCQVKLYVQANNSSGAYIAITGPSITLTNEWQRFSYAYSNLPAGTSQVLIVPYVAAIDTGDSFDVYMSAAQIEKGTFPTSYIPTTSSAVTRNADLVSIPVTNWSANTGTFATVVGQTAVGAYLPRIFDWTANSAEQIYWVRGVAGASSIAIVNANSINYQASVTSTSGYDTLIFSYSVGSKLAQYLNGGSKSESASVQAAASSSLPSGAFLGNGGGSNRAFNGSIARFIVYSSALSDSDAVSVTNAIKDGL